MVILDNPEIPFEKRVHNKEFIAAVESMCRYVKPFPTDMETLIQVAEYHEQYLVRFFNILAKRKDDGLFFGDLRDASALRQIRKNQKGWYNSYRY